METRHIPPFHRVECIENRVQLGTGERHETASPGHDVASTRSLSGQNVFSVYRVCLKTVTCHEQLQSILKRAQNRML